MTDTNSSWTDSVINFVNSIGAQGGILLGLPEYRPDLAKAVANRLDLDFYDYRAEEMSRLGSEAGKLSLGALNETLQRRSNERGTLVFNVEALLATKSPAERRAWLERFVRTGWTNLVIVPLTLYAEDASDVTMRILRFAPEELPAQSLINRLRH
jgi:hypothetical protein